MNKQHCVYMLSNQRNGTLYIGVTSDLIKRVYQHRIGMMDGFTKRYGIRTLVWDEMMATEPLVARPVDRVSFAIPGFWIPAIPAGMTGEAMYYELAEYSC